jgi:hypothetical protein
VQVVVVAVVAVVAEKNQQPPQPHLHLHPQAFFVCPNGMGSLVHHCPLSLFPLFLLLLLPLLPPPLLLRRLLLRLDDQGD